MKAHACGVKAHACESRSRLAARCVSLYHIVCLSVCQAQQRAKSYASEKRAQGQSVSQSVTTTLLAGCSWTTHTLLFFYFEYGDNPCIVVFFSCLPPGPEVNPNTYNVLYSAIIGLTLNDLRQNDAVTGWVAAGASLDEAPCLQHADSAVLAVPQRLVRLASSGWPSRHSAALRARDQPPSRRPQPKGRPRCVRVCLHFIAAACNTSLHLQPYQAAAARRELAAHGLRALPAPLLHRRGALGLGLGLGLGRARVRVRVRVWVRALFQLLFSIGEAGTCAPDP